MSSSSTTTTDPKQIVILDLPTRPPVRAWSLNPWKTRLLLNYKGIPYTTRWISYPDVQTVISPHVAPNPPGTAIKDYTIPTIVIPSALLLGSSEDKWVMESLTIANELDKLFPEPKLQISSPVLDDVMGRIKKIMAAAAPEYMARIPARLLDERGQGFWYPDREKRVGMPLQQLEDEKGGQQVTENVREEVQAIGRLLEENGGPFFEGKQVSYVDFVWGALLWFLKGIGEDTYENVIGRNDVEKGVHKRLLEAIKEDGWFDRDDH